MPSLWADSLKNTNSTMDKLIVNYDDAMTEYPTGCVLFVKSTTMDAVIPGEDYLIVTDGGMVSCRFRSSFLSSYNYF